MTPGSRGDSGELSPALAESGLVDVAGAASYLGVTAPFVRRLVLERRLRYFKLGKFVRFKIVDLDAFIEAGRHEPVAPWVHPRSTLRGAPTQRPAQQGKSSRRAGAPSRPRGKAT